MNILNQNWTPRRFREEAPGDGPGDGPGTGGGDDWRAGLSEEYREHEGLKDIKDLNGLVKSHLSAQEMIGKSVRIPGEDTDDETRERFFQDLAKVDGVIRIPTADDEDGQKALWTKLGRPDDAKGYEFERPKDLPPGTDYSDDMETWFRDRALAHNMPKAMAEGMFKDYQEFIGAQGAAMVEQYKAVEAELKKAWGQDYEKRAEIAHNMAKKFGGEELLVLMETVKTPDGKTLGNSPAFIKAMYDIAAKTQEDGVLQGDELKGESRDEIEAKINELKAHSAYLDKNHLEHESIVKKVDSLYKALEDYK